MLTNINKLNKLLEVYLKLKGIKLHEDKIIKIPNLLYNNIFYLFHIVTDKDNKTSEIFIGKIIESNIEGNKIYFTLLITEEESTIFLAQNLDSYKNAWYVKYLP